jgi:hypothetical protein
MLSHAKTNRRRRFSVEMLEERAVPATFGVPWQDPSRLSLSFAPDGTPIAGHTSSLFQTLNAQQPTAVWQHEILQAFQTWAVQANINIGLVADGGQAFGIAGPSQHDARFGDIRVGAQPMSADALSISVPNDPTLSSTLTGDVLVNSNEVFGSHNLDLFAVLLHEAGHVFGIGDSTDPTSPMYSSYNDRQQLTSSDISALQALYGTRSLDPHEGSSGNDTVGTATQIPVPGGFNGATPLVVYGDISSNRDADFFSVRPQSSYTGPVTFRLQSTGISLLTTHLTVMDGQGNVVGEAQASSDFGDTVTVHLDHADPSTTYYLKVEGATHDVFGIGSYGLAATFDNTNQVTPSALDAVLRGPYPNLNSNDLALILSNQGQILFNNQQNNSVPGSATQLTTTPGFAQNSHFETVSSLSDPADVSYYRIQPINVSNGQNLVLTVTLRAVAPNGAAPRVTILDGNQNVISAQILTNGNGVFTIQATNLRQGGNYLLQVSANGSTAGVGNYALDAQFGTSAANLSTFANGDLSAAASQQSYNFYVGESQLFQFVLAANSPSAPPGSAVQMTVLDQNGNVVYSLTAAAGDATSSNALFLTPGAYTLRFAAVGPAGGTPPPLSYALMGEVVSDPIGPTVSDPSLTPVYTAPGNPGIFTYPGSVTTTQSYWIAPAPN